MIIGAHTLIYSKDAEADRAFFRDILKFPQTDAGDGYLIFGLSSSEMAVHQGETNNSHELFLMCEDIDDLVAHMKKHNIPCEDISDQGWGLLTRVTLPGGGILGIYQPRHDHP